jgi:hypothetical protein
MIDEERGDAPNSSFISKALNNHPVLRFVSTAATTMASAFVLSKITKQGGLKLAKTVQDRADSGASRFASNIVNVFPKIRREFDELSGVSRMIDGNTPDQIDPYSRLVFETAEGKLTTGVIKHTDRGYHWTAGEISKSGKGIEYETAGIWGFREEAQSRLVSMARRMPYELPAMYVGQKAIVDPIFGGRDDSKVKWYNPVDVVTDFVKDSTINLVTMMIPMEVGGAAIGNARSSLSNFRYSMSDLARSTGTTDLKTRSSRAFVNLADMLSEVGHDLADITQKGLKVSAQTSGAIKAATTEYSQQRVDINAILSRTRNLRAKQIYEDSKGSKLKRARNVATQYAFGNDASGNSGYLDLFPGLRGVGSAVRQGINQFRKVGYGYDVITRAIDFDAAVQRYGAANPNAFRTELKGIVGNLQANSSNRMTTMASKIARTFGGPAGSDNFYASEFYKGIEQTEYKKVLYKSLMERTATSDRDEFARTIAKFVDDIDVSKTAMEPSRRVTIGETKILLDGDEPFDEIINRFKGTLAKTRADEFVQKVGNSDVLKDSIIDANRLFTGAQFQAALKGKANKAYKAFQEQGMVKVAGKVLKTKKADFEDFLDLDNLSYAQKDFLVKRSAQRLGMRLKTADGRDLTRGELGESLGKVGLNIKDAGQLRSFLVREKQISSGVFASGFNLLGLRRITVDEANQRGVFANVDDETKRVINQMSSSMVRADPTTTAASVSVLPDVFITKTGSILDVSGIRQSARNVGNFLANDLRIPVLGFNPADLAAKQSFNEMSGRAPFQFIQGRVSQPFLQGADKSADFYLFYSGGRTKGNVMAFNYNVMAQQYTSRTLDGTFRPLAKNSSQLLTRAARNAAAERDAESLNSLSYQEGTFRSRFFSGLSRFGMTPEREFRFREFFDINYDQPNSVFGFLSRFSRRNIDPENPRFLAQVMTGKEIPTKAGTAKRNIVKSADGTVEKINVIDVASGEEMVSEKALLEAFEGFRRRTRAAGFSRRAMKRIEEADPALATYHGQKITDLQNVQEKIDFANVLLRGVDRDANILRRQGIDPVALYQSGSRINKVLEEADLLSGSQIRSVSPTIISREDELTNEMFKFLIQRNELVSNSTRQTFGQNFIKINQALTSMAKEIPAGELAEAQAAAFGALTNLNSVRANRSFLKEIEVQRRALANVIESLESAPELAQPFISGSIERVGEIGRLGLFKKLLYPSLSTASFKISHLATDPLGSATGPGADVLLVPTFGSVFSRNPIGALKSVAGINTYSSPESYSNLSAAVSHGVERLNKYFGTVGLQLDVNQYGSPLDLFARGMVGKRVLPLYAGGMAFMTADRTIGGMVNEKDARGERVYSPFFVGAAAKAVGEIHALGAGAMPGGMSYEEKREQLFEGEVPIRQGRFWPLGNTPFMGGKIMYYRPSIYRKIETGAMFTSDTYGSPIERALFYTDISPLRPLDPYRFERKHYEDRPYPITGEYFSGPFGPLTPALNATVGRVLKPQIKMHEQEVSQALSNYAPAGQSGAYDASAYLRQISMPMLPGQAPQQQFGQASIGGAMQGAGPIMSMGMSSGGPGPGMQASSNAELAGRAGALNTAKYSTMQNIGQINSQYAQMAYGPPKTPGMMPPRIVGAGSPISVGNPQVQIQEFGYRTQEALGIYGFAGAAFRESFGYGQGDFEPQRAVLQSASKAYGMSRQFWDYNLGGLGDVPMLGGRNFGSIEFSEITRRFIPKERTGVDYLNPIQNTMGQQYPFLPGPEYYLDFTRGDPFTKVQEGELRLPGVAYERLNQLRSDETGRYGLLDQFKILGDVAPYSKQYRYLDKKIDSYLNDPSEKLEADNIRNRVASIQQKENFSEYSHVGKTAAEAGTNPLIHNISRAAEYIAHRDTFINRKFINKQTAVEDWERNNVYGATFPEWQRPFESFVEPMINKAADRNPIAASASLAAAGLFAGRTQPGKLVMSGLGAVTGLAASAGANLQEAITGDRFIPTERKKELALEEYSDILTYVKNTRLANMAEASGDAAAAFQFSSAAKRTMYGAPIQDIGTGKYGTDVESLSLAIPKRKREHFKAMINAPEQDRERILSTAGRLERRIYEAAWGMQVEKRPELTDYFSRHELPDEGWEGWHPNTNMDSVKIKIGQHMGLEMSQMGYYPQQIREANLANPSYPRFGYSSDSNADVAYRLRSLMNGMGVTGSVTPVMNPFGGQQVDISAGVR